MPSVSGFKRTSAVKAESKREQRKNLFLLCRAGAGSITQSVIKGESLALHLFIHPLNKTKTNNI